MTQQLTQQRQDQYLQLIERLLACPNGEEPNILDAQPDLLDAGFVQTLVKVGTMMAHQENLEGAKFLFHVARELAIQLNLLSSTHNSEEIMETLNRSIDEVGQLAIAFLVQDLEIPREDQDWFSVLNVRSVGETWHVVEIGVEGLPDRWVLQVYDTGECDPSYTFQSPVSATEADTGLEDLPEAIAHILAAERSHH